MTVALLWFAFAVCTLALWSALWYATEARAERMMRHAYEAMYTEHIARLNDAHAAELDRVTRAIAYGTPNAPAAVVVPSAPDAEHRLQRRVQEDTIAAGAAALKAEYESAGLMLTDDEAREQAASMLLGLSPTVA